jgi:tetratricopeptide (TPR) repeat protein
MFPDTWLQEIETQIEEIKTKYPQASSVDKEKWRERFHLLKKTSHELLEVWARIEEKMALITSEYPEIESEEQPLEEFWLSEPVVRQFRQGQGYYGLTMFAEAERFFTDVIAKEPEFLLGRLYLGLCQFQQQNWEAAMQHFHLVVGTATMPPFLTFAHHMIGCIHVKLGQEHAAIRSFQQAIKHEKENADAWFNLGAAYYRLADYHQAIPAFYHALALRDNDWEVMYYLSHCYRHLREWKSVTYWRLAALEKSKHPQVLLSLAHDYEEMRQPEEAIRCYRRLLDHPTHKRLAYQGLSWNYWVLQQKETAMGWVKRGLTLFRDDPDLLFTYIWICLAEGDVTAAQRAYSRLSEEVKTKPIWKAMKIRMSTTSGNFEEVSAMAQQLIQQEQPMVQAMGYYQQGRSMLEMGKIPEAIEQFQHAQARAAKWKEPLFYEGVCHLLEGRSEQTLACWEKL